MACGSRSNDGAGAAMGGATAANQSGEEGDGHGCSPGARGEVVVAGELGVVPP